MPLEPKLRTGSDQPFDLEAWNASVPNFRLKKIGEGEYQLEKNTEVIEYEPSLEDALVVIAIEGVRHVRGYRIAECWGIPVSEAILRIEEMVARGRAIIEAKEEKDASS